jgi:hypothetical protein
VAPTRGSRPPSGYNRYVRTQTIEPVAESFGSLDPDIDARVNDVAQGHKWTGFHRIEQALWQKHTTDGMAPVADQLLADVQTLGEDAHARLPAGRARQRCERPPRRGRGLQDHRRGEPLLAHRPLRLPRERHRLAADIPARFDAVRKELDTLGPSGRFPSYDTVDDAERARLSALVKALRSRWRRSRTRSAHDPRPAGGVRGAARARRTGERG